MKFYNLLLVFMFLVLGNQSFAIVSEQQNENSPEQNEITQGPQINWELMPRYIGGRPDGGDEGVSPSAFYIAVDNLEPNTDYFSHSTASFGFLDGTSTRGNFWSFIEEDWVGPSYEEYIGTTDDEGRLEYLGFVRPPSNFFNEELNYFALRFRAKEEGQNPHSFNSDNNMTSLHWDEEATGETAGHLLTGYVVEENHYGNLILAFEDEEDERPLAAFRIQPHSMDGVNNLEEDDAYFQFMVPANVTVRKFEIRDENNSVVQTVNGEWGMGDAGEITDVGAIVGELPPKISWELSPKYIGGRPDGDSDGVSPSAFYIAVDNLEPNTDYYSHNVASFGFLDGTSTRGNFWSSIEEDWVGPSYEEFIGTTDADGRLEYLGFIRPPSNFFNEELNYFALRFRAKEEGQNPHSFNSDNNMTSLHWDEEATGETAGHLLTGYVVEENHYGNLILAYEDEEDDRPLAAFRIQPHGMDGVNNLEVHDAYFQVMVPANVTVSKFEIRNPRNQLLQTITGNWEMGDAGDITDVGAIVGEMPPMIDWAMVPKYVGGRPDGEDDGVSPSGFYIAVDNLEPNTDYFSHNVASFGLKQKDGTATRGGFWSNIEEDWVGPSYEEYIGTSDIDGRLEYMGFWRAPSEFFSEELNDYHIRFRVKKEGENPMTFESSNMITSLHWSDEATGETAGHLLTGHIGVQDYHGAQVLAFENEDDERPLAAFRIQPHGMDGVNSLDETAPDYFQLMIPANITVRQFEVRDLENEILNRVTGEWEMGNAGDITDVGLLLGDQRSPLLTILSPQYVAGRPDDGDSLANPNAFHFSISNLSSNTAYETHDVATLGLKQKGSPTTRGSVWSFEEEDWVSPSHSQFIGLTDDEGDLSFWGYWNAPGTFFSEEMNDYHIRLRVRVAGSTEPIEFEEGKQSPNNITTLNWAEDATGPTAGAVITGIMNDPNFYNQHILAYENEDDSRPLAAWKIVPNDQYHGSNMADSAGGFFQLNVPANTSIGKLEIRDDDNEVILSAVSNEWQSGNAGTVTHLNDQEAIITNVEEFAEELPEEFILKQNYPNPFNPVTTIKYEIPEQADVTLDVFNIQGQRIATLVDKQHTQGSYSIEFDASNLPSGIYLYRLRAGNTSHIQKMTLIK